MAVQRHPILIGCSGWSYPDWEGAFYPDGMRAAEISLENVRVGPEGVLGDPGGALPVVERVVDEAIAALCAEAVGIMGAMQETTVDYLKTRKQFGMPIGGFQALQTWS